MQITLAASKFCPAKRKLCTVESKFCPVKRKLFLVKRKCCPDNRKCCPVKRNFCPDNRKFCQVKRKFCLDKRKFCSVKRKFYPVKRKYCPGNRQFCLTLICHRADDCEYKHHKPKTHHKSRTYLEAALCKGLAPVVLSCKLTSAPFRRRMFAIWKMISTLRYIVRFTRRYIEINL